MTQEDNQILNAMTNISFRDLMILEGVLIRKKIITKEDFKEEHKYLFGEKKIKKKEMI